MVITVDHTARKFQAISGLTVTKNLFKQRRYNMSTAKPKPKAKRRRVTFALDFPLAGEVILMGDFNQWNPKTHPMKKDNGGVWKKNTLLYPGRYEYRFMVDGQWLNDPDNPRTCPNSYGSYNNIVVVS
jgi:1,4-alpha-glucan branching enzyme